MLDSTYEKWLLRTSPPGPEFGGGRGSSWEDAYHLSSALQLRKLAQDVNAGISYAGTYFRLLCDIDLEGADWSPIGYCIGPFDKMAFSGFFDGGGHRVHNFRVERSVEGSVGLFGYVEYARIYNLAVADCTLTGIGSIGALAGYAEESAFLNCNATATVTVKGMNAGGLVGLAGSTSVENCSAQVALRTFVGSERIGGLCGYSYNGGTFISCRAAGEIQSADGTDVGGFVGQVRDAKITGCSAGVFLRCANSGNVGGFVGALRGGTTEGCLATGNIESTSGATTARLGGFAGYLNGPLAYCVASGNVVNRGNNAAAGGCVGEAVRSRIFACYSVGDVDNGGGTGGFLGRASGGGMQILDCYATGSVVLQGKMKTGGGFVGILGGEGGFVELSRCYAFGEVSPNVSGFTARKVFGGISACFWRADEGGVNDGVKDAAGIAPISTESFGMEEHFAENGWSFAEGSEAQAAWHYLDGMSPKRPHLRGLPAIPQTAPFVPEEPVNPGESD